MCPAETTCLSDELAELARWHPRSPATDRGIFERFVRREFLSTDEQEAGQTAALGRLLQFAGNHVPHYRELCQTRLKEPGKVRSLADLRRLPILTRADIVKQAAALKSDWLPPGEGALFTARSTGTTGTPVSVLISRTGSRMFGLLWHRQARWFRYDPAGRFAKIRVPSTMPRSGGKAVPAGAALRRPSWYHLGRYFQTGPELNFSTKNPAEKQVAWLRRFRPDYLLAYPGVFEELGLACEGTAPVESLKSLLGIGATATPALRSAIERIYQVPFDQNYGLNEVGLVAIRCRAGRYHVNTEHCLVEITDADGTPCPAGTSGHLLVTGLQNLAMPLIRYDTGDIALAVEGPCPCGRTLPSFGEISGRFRRYSGLPEGTRERVAVLGEALAAMPPELTRALRRYQIHQDRRNHFSVRLHTTGPLPAEFTTRLQEAWSRVAGNPPLPLSVGGSEPISESPGGKTLDFASDFYAEADRASLVLPGDKPTLDFPSPSH